MNVEHDGEHMTPTGSILKRSTWTTPIERRRGLRLAFSTMALVMAFAGISELSEADRHANRESRILNEDVAPQREKAIAALTLSGLAGATSIVLGRAARRTASPGPSSPSPTDRMSLAADLSAVVKMHAEGKLTDDEFRIAKQRLLNGPNP